MKSETSNKLAAFLDGEIDSNSFQNWLFEPTTESKLDTELFIELIQIDYTSKNSKHNVKTLIRDFKLLGKLHYESINNIIDKLLKEQCNPLKEIEKLNKWADKGYTFLGQIDIIGNYGEQGKSIVYEIQIQMNPEKQFQLLNAKHPKFKTELKLLKEKLENGRINITGKSKEVKGFGEIFEYETE